MGHLCGSTCKQKTGAAGQTCRTPGKARVVALDVNGKPVSHGGTHTHATLRKKSAAVDMHFDGLSYCGPAEKVGQYFGRKTHRMTVYRWVRELTEKEDEILRPMKVAPAIVGLPMGWWSISRARNTGCLK